MRAFDAKWALVLLAVAFVGITAWSLRYFRRYQPFADLIRENSQTELGRIGIQVNDAIVVGRSNGRERWRVSARSIILSQDRRRATVDLIHNGVILDATGRKVVSLSAGQAAYDSLLGLSPSGLQGSLTLQNGVRAEVLRPGGPILTAQSMTWAACWNAVRIPGRVTAQFPHGAATLSGDNAYYDLRTGNMTLRHLSGMFQLPNAVQ